VPYFAFDPFQFLPIALQMAPLNFLIAGLNFTRAETVGAGFYQFVADRSLVLSGAEILSEAWSEDSWLTKASEWLSRPGEEIQFSASKP
jgi:hypothetical protein